MRYLGNGRWEYTQQDRDEADRRQMDRARKASQQGGFNPLRFLFRRFEYIAVLLFLIVGLCTYIGPILTFVSKIFSGLSF